MVGGGVGHYVDRISQTLTKNTGVGAIVNLVHACIVMKAFE